MRFNRSPYVCYEFKHRYIVAIYVPPCLVVASKLRVGELTGRKEAGFTTSTLQNSRQKLQCPVHMMPKD